MLIGLSYYKGVRNTCKEEAGGIHRCCFLKCFDIKVIETILFTSVFDLKLKWSNREKTQRLITMCLKKQKEGFDKSIEATMKWSGGTTFINNSSKLLYHVLNNNSFLNFFFYFLSSSGSNNVDLKVTSMGEINIAVGWRLDNVFRFPVKDHEWSSKE